MPYAASCSRASNLATAVHEVCSQLQGQLFGAAPDLVFAFVSHAHAGQFDKLPRLIHDELQPRVLLGCTGETIVGGGEEIESGPALSVWSATLQGTTIKPFHAQFSETPDGIVCTGLPDVSDLPRGTNQAVFFLGEPFSCAPQSVINQIAEDLPAAPLLGGMASGATQPGTNRLFLNADSIKFGGVGAVLYGGPSIRTTVSQGCRPVGSTYVITKAEKNVVFELGGRPALEQLQELFQRSTPTDQERMRQGMHLGLAMNEYQDTFRPGDFLIANVIGADNEQGALAVGKLLRVGQTVQFHVRDAETADEDLHQLLGDQSSRAAPPPKAALLFSCNGRGTRLFPQPHHDATAIQSQFGPIPLAGFFAQGELGPVGGRNYIHGYTASIALFE